MRVVKRQERNKLYKHRKRRKNKRADVKLKKGGASSCLANHCRRNHSKRDHDLFKTRPTIDEETREIAIQTKAYLENEFSYYFVCPFQHKIAAINGINLCLIKTTDFHFDSLMTEPMEALEKITHTHRRG